MRYKIVLRLKLHVKKLKTRNKNIKSNIPLLKKKYDVKDEGLKMFYRSDWPEVGLSMPVNKLDSQAHIFQFQADKTWVQEKIISGVESRWIATRSTFETNLYGLPVWNLHFELEDEAGAMLNLRLDDPKLQDIIKIRINRLVKAPPWKTAYVMSKLVKNEFLYDALHKVGFEEVECRCLYRSNVRDIASKTLPFSQDNIKVTSLAAIAPEQIPSYRQQVLEICQEAFENEGYSRHFTDPVLKERLPGVAYIQAVMALNFKHIAPNHFLVALDICSNNVCGFSVVGKKPGLSKNIYTQLLSVVKKEYRGQKIYHAFSSCLLQILSPDSILLNVTHSKNRNIQKAYRKSGRVHLVDTVVMRRLFQTRR